jgi:O-antigen/teichoic acid export membrane protein
MTSAIARVRALTAVPLYRNAYALLLNTAGTGALGIAFWIVAAHVLPARDVGNGAAVVNAMLFISGVAQLNLLSFLGRFLPVAGQEARRLVIGAYGVSVGASLVCSLVFLLLVRTRVISASVPSAGIAAALFVLSTCAYSVFALQDGVLTGLRSAHWVPLENVSFGVAKIVLLPVMAAFGVGLAIFYAWSIAIAIAVPAVSWLIFRRLIDDPARRPTSGTLPARRSLVRFFAADYAGSILLLAGYLLTPIVIVQVVGPVQGGYFAVAWTLATSADLIAFNMGSSLTVEGAIAPHLLGEHLRGILRHQLRLVVPIAIVLAVAAPVVLRPFGAAYAEHSSTLLRLMAIALVPRSVLALAISVWRVDRTLLPLIVTNGLTAAAVLGAAGLLAASHGSNTVAVAWLATQTLLCAVYLPGLRRRMSDAR